MTAPSYDDDFFNEGLVRIYHGGPTGPTAALTLTGGQVSSGFGVSASTAGDLNGDGFGDLLIGADRYDVSHTDEGAVFFYLGNADTPEGGISIFMRTTILPEAPYVSQLFRDRP